MAALADGALSATGPSGSRALLPRSAGNDRWGWTCGFYPGSHPDETTSY